MSSTPVNANTRWIAAVPRTTARLWWLLRANSLFLMSSFNPEHVHERQAVQVQHDVAQAIGLGFQAVEHLCDLRHREKVELAAKRDQGGATVPTRLDGQLVCGEPFCDRSGGLF
jgi:hypothetical protein